MKRTAATRDWIATARTLSEALPYLQRYEGATIVIKLGGHAMSGDGALEGFARDIALMSQVGVKPVIVHGGGPAIDEMLRRLGIESRFKDGRRITDEAAVGVVEMVLAGSINKRIVAAINSQGGRAVGISGKDAKLMICRQADPALGYVGTPKRMNTEVLTTLFEASIIPVIAPLGTDEAGNTYNVNADTAAGAIAGALKARRLLLLTDVDGVRDAEGALLSEVSATQIREMTGAGTIAGGMIPKTETALAALGEGVRAAVILDGRAPNACLLELFTDHGAGTIIRLG